MNFIEWKNEYSIGNDLIDSQHKQILKLINQLFDAIKENKGETLIEKSICDMVDYASYHFSNEESLMRNTNYPLIRDHKISHVSLVKEVTEYFYEYYTGIVRTPDEILLFLFDWIVNHILDVDLEFGKYLKKIKHNGK